MTPPSDCFLDEKYCPSNGLLFVDKLPVHLARYEKRLSACLTACSDDKVMFLDEHLALCLRQRGRNMPTRRCCSLVTADLVDIIILATSAQNNIGPSVVPIWPTNNTGAIAATGTTSARCQTGESHLCQAILRALYRAVDTTQPAI